MPTAHAKTHAPTCTFARAPIPQITSFFFTRRAHGVPGFMERASVAASWDAHGRANVAAAVVATLVARQVPKLCRLCVLLAPDAVLPCMHACTPAWLPGSPQARMHTSRSILLECCWWPLCDGQGEQGKT